MKLYQTHNGTWILRHRSFFFLFFGAVLLGSIPPALLGWQGVSPFAAIIYLIFGVMCLYYFAEFSTLEISGSSIRYKRNLLLYRQTVSKERSQLLSVSLEYSPSMRSNGKRIKFSFADDTCITMPKAFVDSTIGWSIDKICDSIRDILPELNQDTSDEILSLLSQGHKMKAIHLVRRQYGMSLVEAKAFVEDLKPESGIQSPPDSPV